MTNDADRSGSKERADAVVMFGLTGDLGEKKLFPALYDLARAGRLGVPVIGVGRTEYSDDELRTMLDDALDGYEPSDGSDFDQSVADDIDLSYLSGDSTEPETFDALLDRLGGANTPVVYAALPPAVFGDVARGIAASSFPDTTRLVVEKPFGEDAESAQSLYDEITAELDPSRLLLVDHFLAKSAIENMLVVRSSNPLIENSMSRRFVESVDIVMTETGGVDGRGSFYESVGAIDDVIQNHLLQMLAVLMMERPDGDTDAAFHESRSTLLAAVEPFDPAHTVLGQFSGYRDLDDVDDDSSVETYVATRTTIDNDRWRGVPITMTTGKELADQVTEAVITLKDGDAGGDAVTNRIRFGVKPHTCVEFEISVLDPETHHPTPTVIEAYGPADHGPLADYAVMLDNAMDGETRHFAQIDDVVSAWKIVGEIKAADIDVQEYEPGSAGPDASR